MKLDHRCFVFSVESLKVEIFFNFFSSLVLRHSSLLLPLSLLSHLWNSAEFTEFYQVIPSFNQFNARLVSGIGIDVVRPDSMRPRKIQIF